MFEVLAAINIAAGMRGELSRDVRSRMIGKVAAVALIGTIFGLAMLAEEYSDLQLADLVVTPIVQFVVVSGLSGLCFWIGKGLRAVAVRVR